MKNQKIGFYVYLSVAVLSIVALVFYIINSTHDYYHDFSAGLLVLILCAGLLSAGVAFFPSKEDNAIVKYVKDFARVAVGILVIWAAALFIGARVESFGYIFGSNLELGNEGAFQAGTQAIYLIVIFVVTWIVSLVAAFLPIGPKESKAVFAE